MEEEEKICSQFQLLNVHYKKNCVKIVNESVFGEAKKIFLNLRTVQDQKESDILASSVGDPSLDSSTSYQSINCEE